MGFPGEFIADQGQAFGTLLPHIVADQVRAGPVAAVEQGRGQLGLDPPHSEEPILVAVEGLLRAVHLEKDRQQGVCGRRPVLLGELDQAEEIVRHRLDQEFHVRVVGDLAVVAHEIRALGGQFVITPVDQSFGKLAVLIEDVIGQAQVASIDRCADIAVEKLDAEPEHRPTFVLGFDGEVSSSDGQETAHVPALTEAAGKEFEVLTQDLDLEPALFSPELVAHAGRHGDEVGIPGQFAVQLEEVIGKRVSDLPIIQQEIVKGIGDRHGDGSVLMGQGSSSQIRQFLDGFEDFDPLGLASLGVATNGDQGLGLQSPNRVQRRYEGKNEREIRQQDDEADRQHGEGKPKGGLGEKSLRRNLASEGRRDPEAEHSGQDEETQDDDVDGLADEEVGDPMRVPGRRQFDHDRHDGDHDGEQGGDDLGRIPHRVQRRAAVDTTQPERRVGLERQPEALEPGHHEVEPRRREEKRSRREAGATGGPNGSALRGSAPGGHYQSEPPETVRSCMVRPAASSRQRKQARAPISLG